MLLHRRLSAAVPEAPRLSRDAPTAAISFTFPGGQLAVVKVALFTISFRDEMMRGYRLVYRDMPRLFSYEQMACSISSSRMGAGHDNARSATHLPLVKLHSQLSPVADAITASLRLVMAAKEILAFVAACRDADDTTRAAPVERSPPSRITSLPLAGMLLQSACSRIGRSPHDEISIFKMNGTPGLRHCAYRHRQPRPSIEYMLRSP